MGSKFLVMFLLGMGLTYGQSLTVTATLDTAPFVELINAKDMEIKKCKNIRNSRSKALKQAEIALQGAMTTIDSLEYYKKYYNHSKNVIGPRVIRKIEDMIKEDE